MPQSVDVLMVPRDMVPLCWDHALPFLAKGVASATNTSLDKIATKLLSGDECLWLVAEEKKLVAAFVAGRRTDDGDGKDYLALYGLGGDGLVRWASAIDAAMQATAKHMGIVSIRFVGRQAYKRILPGLAVKGSVGNQSIYERAAQ